MVSAFAWQYTFELFKAIFKYVCLFNLCLQFSCAMLILVQIQFVPHKTGQNYLHPLQILMEG